MTANHHKGNDQTTLHRIAASISEYWQTAQLRSTLRRERGLLSSLDDRMLKDIGITRTEANIESARPGWDVPDFRLPVAPKQDGCPSVLAQIAGWC